MSTNTAENLQHHTVPQHNYQPTIVINNSNSNSNSTNTSTKSRLVLSIICFLFGIFGIHRFMTGHLISGTIYLFTFGLFGIGVFIDFLYILTGGFKEKNGNIVS